MSETSVIIVLLAVATIATKTSGPLLIGHRELPSWTLPVIAVLPGALLTALIVVQVVGGRNEVVIDERLIGLAAAGAVLFQRRNAIIAAMVAAAGAAALARALL